MILYKKTFSRDLHTEIYACFLKEITNVSLALPLLKGKSSNLVCVGECHVTTSMHAIGRKIAEMLDGPVIIQGEGGSSHNSTAACVLVN